ncbi:MAG: hypothetical protein AB8G86_09015 [Saprospiraceae bacterium]
MTINNNIQAAIWIHQSRDTQSDMDFVKSIIPKQYDCYFKLFLPIIFENEETGQSKNVTYEQLAALGDLPFDDSFCQHSIPDFITPFIASSSEEDYKILTTLISILGAESPVIFHGVGEDNVPEKFADLWLIEGKMAEFTEVVSALNENTKIELIHFPNYIFPLDKNWCLGNLIPKSGLFLLGCNSVIAEELRNQDEIEAVELSVEAKYFEFPSPV